MDRLQVDGDAVGLEDARERRGDLASHPLLNGEPPGEETHQPGELGDADDVLVGDVTQVGVAEERKGVMLAQRMKGYRPFDHLAQVAVRTALAFRRNGSDQLVIALVTL